MTILERRSPVQNCLIRCVCCRKSVASAWQTATGQAACDDCLKNRPDCPYCERAILAGEGIDYTDGVAFCYGCAAGKPSCSACNRPNFGEHASLCERCLETQPCCSVCECQILGVIYTGGGTLYCAACRPCRHCWRVGMSPNDSGCIDCQDKIYTAEEAGPSLEAALDFLAEEFGMELVTVPELRVSSDPGNYCVLRYSTQERIPPAGMHSPEGWIWIRAGAGRPVLMATLVHELTHHWQLENCPAQSLELTEGLAVWTELFYLQSNDYLELAEGLKSRFCEVYGEGLRGVMKWESAVGREGVVAGVQSASDFPLWVQAWQKTVNFLNGKK